MKRATVKRRERVALQTLRTAEAMMVMSSILSPWWIGTSCMTAATTARGPGEESETKVKGAPQNT